MNENVTYKLRCSMPGHSKDVRCVTVGDIMEECIVSGSRDKTAKLWLPEGYVLIARKYVNLNCLTELTFYRHGFVCDQTYTGNEGYVSAVAVGSCSDNFPSGAVITGCQDGKIRIYNPGTVNPASTLSGHTDTGMAN